MAESSKREFWKTARTFHRFNQCKSSSTLCWSIKKRGEQSIGTSKGGKNTKIHASCGSEKIAVDVQLSAGQIHDSKCFMQTYKQAKARLKIKNIVADRGYDSNEIRDKIKKDGKIACIPPRKNRIQKMTYSKTI